jgi:hypothetical protein
MATTPHRLGASLAFVVLANVCFVFVLIQAQLIADSGDDGSDYSDETYLAIRVNRSVENRGFHR